MEKNFTNIVDYIFIILGTSYGLDTIESLLGIIILSFQILWILSKFIIRINQRVKDKDYESIENDIKETLEELKDFKDGSEK